jgi:hypothetical protein
MNVTLLSDRVRTSPLTGRVVPRDLPRSEPSASLEADFAARRTLRVPQGGVASFQVVVTTEVLGDGADIALRVTPFVGPAGSLDRVEVYYEWPCRIAEDEWTFEALVPLEVYRAAASEVRRGPLGPRRHHAFWVDVPVWRGTAPGTYVGRVRADQTQLAEVTIDVLPVTLPLTPRVTVDLNAYSEALHTQHHPGLTGPDQVACERSYYREAHDHRAVLHYLPYDHAGNVTEGYAPPLSGRGRNLRVADWSAYDARFGPLFSGTAMAGSAGGERPIPHWYLPFNYAWPADFAYFGTRGYDWEFAAVLAEFRRHFQEKGWTQTNFEIYFNHKKRYRYFAWDGDERKHAADKAHFLHFRSLLDRAARLAGPAGARARILNRTDISWSFAQDVTDDQMGPIFDLWVVGAGNFAWTSFGVAAIHRRHQLAWWYGGVGGPERPTMDADRQVILCWRRGADGFLASWLNLAVDDMLDEANALSMLYPGRRFGPDRALGSIRLRRVRSATETADCLELLGDRGRVLVDRLAGVQGDEDWFTPTPSWAFWPTERMDNDMYGWQRGVNPLETNDPHLPALIRERALDEVLRTEQQCA